MYFRGIYSKKWKKRGIELLKNQLKEQVLKDGGHFEKSPMYHSIILEDILDIINILESEKTEEMNEFRTELVSYVKQMLNWLFWMIHPKDLLPFFNDTTDNIAPKFSEILNYSKRLGIKFDLPKIQNFKLNYLQERLNLLLLVFLLNLNNKRLFQTNIFDL